MLKIKQSVHVINEYGLFPADAENSFFIYRRLGIAIQVGGEAYELTEHAGFGAGTYRDFW